MGVTGPNTILVTGSDGFIGRQLVSTLRESGRAVLEFDRKQGDIATFDFSGLQVSHIIHLASMVYVPLSWENPAPFYRTNVMGTVNILEHCRKTGCRLTYVSSYIYGTPRYLPVDELHPVDPGSPYNHSKFMAEEACRFYASTFDVPVVVFRPVNIYGPGQRSDFLIPFIIGQVTDPVVPEVTVMDLRPRRDYLYISDFTDALIRSIGMEGFHVFNLGSGQSVSVEEIITTVMETSGITKPFKASGKERPNEIWDVFADIRKYSEASGWKPLTPFREGIRHCLSEHPQKT